MRAVQATVPPGSCASPTRTRAGCDSRKRASSARARGRPRPSAASCTARSTSATGGRTATRSPPAGRCSPCSTPAWIEHRFGIRPIPATAASSRRTGGIVRADALAALAAGVEVRERLRVAPIDEDGDGVTAGGLRARVAVAYRRSLGATARRCRRDADSRDRLVLRPRRARPLGDRHDHRRILRLRAPGLSGRRAEGGAASVRSSRRPRRGSPLRP